MLDLPVIARVGLSGAPADAAAEVRERVHWVSTLGGGRGAVREFIELVLRAQGRWDDVTRDYFDEGLMDGTSATARALIALLAGLATGKAWERYKLRDGRWIDRRRAARIPALHARAELPGRQPNRSGHRGAHPRGRRQPATRSRST